MVELLYMPAHLCMVSLLELQLQALSTHSSFGKDQHNGEPDRSP